jgi:hypothetical protein
LNIALLENASMAVRALMQGIRTEQEPAVIVPAIKHLHVMHDLLYKVMMTIRTALPSP